jgi:DNA (cytosine-5)-methyltransferase 1
VFGEDGVWPALYSGESGGHGYVKTEEREATAYAANQRDEVRDLGGRAAALQAQPGMKQQTFVAVPVNTQIATRHKALGEGTGFGIGSEGDPAYTLQEAHSHGVFVSSESGCLTPWDTQQSRIFTPDGKAPSVCGADGGGGRNPAGLLFSAGVVTKGNGDCFLTPGSHTSLTKGGGQAGQGYPCVLTVGFCAGAAPAARSIGYQDECAPTLKGASSGTNMVPSVLCLNDQGGQRMDLYEDICGTLRAQMDGHPPLVLGSQQGGAAICEDLSPAITAAAGTSGNNQPVLLYENHGIDSRYTGPHEVAPTMSARYGTGGNNVPLVTGKKPESYCIAGNIIDRETHNGGNGFGYQPDISYTLNTADRHCVFSQQRSDEYSKSGVTCTQAARQHKDATDLVCEVAGLDCRNGDENGDLCGTLQSKSTGGYSLNNVHPVRTGNLIRRLTPLECERLQGYDDHWTDIKGGSDSARYKALGNSVAIPCVTFVMRGIAYFLRKGEEHHDSKTEGRAARGRNRRSSEG